MTKRGSKTNSKTPKKGQKRTASNETRASNQMRKQMAIAPVRIGMAAMVSRFSARSMTNGKTSYQHVRCSGRISTLSVTSSTLEGQILFTQNLNPSSFNNSALQLEAALWDRFFLKKLTMTYAPTVGTAVNGSLVGAYDVDAQDENGYVLGTQISLAKFCAHETAAQDSVYRSMSWVFNGSPDLPFLYVNPGADSGEIARWTSPGVFVICANSTFDNTYNLGAIWFDAEYEFTNRNIEAAAQLCGAYTMTITANTTTTTPFLDGVLAVKTGTVNGAFLQTPVIVSSRTLAFNSLDSAKSYLVRIYQGGLTTCSVAGSVTVPAGFGTLVSSSPSFSSTAWSCEAQAVPDASGILRLQYTGATFVAGSTTVTVVITSLPFTTDVIIG
jgi:hypothetical protein